MASGPPAVNQGNGNMALSPAEFERALSQATVSTRDHGFGPRAAPIPELRRALGRRVSRED